MSLNKSEYLAEVLETHRMSKIDNLVGEFKSKRDDVKSALLQHYASKIYSPFDSGSFKKHTAINIKFDLDIVAPFKKNSFVTLENMFDDLYDFISEEYGKVATIRKQKVSIGIEFYEDNDGDIINLDVVPGRELNQDQYLEDKNLNLFVYSKYGLLQSSSHIQTNIQSQIEHIKAKDDERKIIRLFKIWKNSHGEKYKSFLLELITIKAFDKVIVSGTLYEKLKAVMEYINNNVAKDNFKLVDPGNSNNDVIDSLESWERNNLSERMRTIIDRVEQNSDNLKSYFPINEDFKDKEKQNEKYGTKGLGIGASYPPNNQRFG